MGSGSLTGQVNGTGQLAPRWRGSPGWVRIQVPFPCSFLLPGMWT